MKKIFLKRVCSAIALTAVAASTAAMTSFAAVDASPYLEQSRNGFTQDEIDASAVKPVVTVTNEVLSLEYAKANPVRTVEIAVSGANLKYASSGLHIYYDSRLTLNTTPIGTPDAKTGPGAEYLTVKTPTLDPTAADQGMSGFFVCSAADQDYGQDGVIWTMKFTLPSTMKEGDAYPIDIFYKSVPAAEDLFTNAKNNAEGKLMQAYFFTKSINNGITSSYNAANETFKYYQTEGTSEISGTEAMAKCAGLASVDPSSDGVIGIGGAPVTTTTTAPVTTTTTAAPTTTTTAAPTTTTTKAATTTTTKAATTTTTTAATTATTTAATAATTDTTAATAATTDTTAATTAATTKPVTTAATTSKPAASTDSPKTGVAGVGIAVAGLAVAVGTAFVLRKKED